MARKLIDRRDILEDILTNISPIYFPGNDHDKNLTSLYGWLHMIAAKSIEDTVTLEQQRAADYCPELSPSAIHVRETAHIRGVTTHYATPGKCFAIIGVLKRDILTKGTQDRNIITFTIDRRSSIMHNGVPFSLEDDIVIKAVRRPRGYVYAAAYGGEYATYESYIQMFDNVDEFGQELVTMVVQLYQFEYNIQEKTVTDYVRFLYDGIPYDYNNKLAGFEVYYKRTPVDEYVRAQKDHHLTMETTSGIYYNDDDDNIIYILNNPVLNIGTNAMIKVEIRETLGTDGNIVVGDVNNTSTTFSLYRDGAYNYSGVNVAIAMISDTTGASDGDSISDIKKLLIDAKVRRDNITTEHDIITYINDRDANVQVIKKRNDIEDRRYYMYTLLRYNKEIVPATTKRLHLKGITNALNIGDFDRYNQTVDRKVLRAYSKFKLVIPEDPDVEEYAVKVPHDEEEIDGEFYYTCPFMILVNDYNIASLYFTSVNTEIQLTQRPVASIFPFQMICRGVQIYRNAHDAENYDIYRFTVTGTMNTSNDLELVDEENEFAVKDYDAIKCYIVIRHDNTPAAYLEMNIASYDQGTREFTFTGTMKTSDYITETDKLEIVDGLRRVCTDTNYNSVIDFKDGFLEVYFMYKYGEEAAEFKSSDLIFQQLPPEKTEGYALMCGYYNNPMHPYDLLLEYNKFTSCPVTCVPVTETKFDFSIGEVPFIEYNYGIAHVIDMYDTFENMRGVYGSLLKLTTDFDISLKFTATYGISKYITVTGGRKDGDDVVENLHDLNPTFYFKVYGAGVDISELRNFIYEYLRDTYITGGTVFMSNICTLIEEQFPRVRSIKYMGVNNFDASFQEFTYTMPEFNSVDIITRFVPEQLNVTDIRIELDETMS
ncbi:hypothetical protein [uncultured Duncaniella sp.]|uniref:hypothetical protein n=1 Tax=uncultured Duncaniella sp. TaxID=2768039 RepID=UPI002628EDA8|nr:hypothetical protein [uncultured Duncaniella sp.]